eukprot:CAMPEP_0175810288 /NCGR_PEP_ID=MMETSP0107_2-20121207/3245_1 /TAXON_ID=195067 ORGANISM="Goniomonas pacifica, Strain CCMP1869" /NCGR_SAMPLE_ID=MMETSP0107_2 /ASSEMBLY_ACC=CAM_ASM_000203 /LENGTH=158 /DNA_ID=CAMNT_0017122037 /DNA_START=43 /DNA_END=516 /DNA_ORIENTATION=+
MGRLTTVEREHDERNRVDDGVRMLESPTAFSLRPDSGSKYFYVVADMDAGTKVVGYKKQKDSKARVPHDRFEHRCANFRYVEMENPRWQPAHDPPPGAVKGPQEGAATVYFIRVRPPLGQVAWLTRAWLPGKFVVGHGAYYSYRGFECKVEPGHYEFL